MITLKCDSYNFEGFLSKYSMNNQCSLRSHVRLLVAEESLYETVCARPKDSKN